VSAVILDASVAISLVVGESRTQSAKDAVVGVDLVVPDTFWGEVAKALMRKTRDGHIDPADALAAYELLRRLVEYSVATERLGPLAMGLSMDLGHPVYDCFYLAAAIAHEAPLLTADRALHAAAVAGGYGDVVRLVG
jgi:predicted nucleic acid-binding protein